jgi:hypothetical protein
VSTYAFRDASGDLVASFPEFARPIPAHALTEGALEAVEAVRAAGRAKRLDATVAGLVLEHGNPAPVEPYEGDVVTPGARSLMALAAMQGFDVKLDELADRCVVSGIRRDCGFSVEWLRGRASKATWHEPRLRYAMMRDTRPVGVSARDRVALAGNRGAGLGEYHLTIVASPHGVVVNLTTVTERIKAL